MDDGPGLLHTSFLRRWSGETNRILVLCRGLAAEGWRVHLATPEDSVLARRAAEAGLPVHGDFRFRRGMRPADLWHDVASLRRLVRQHRLSFVHTHGAQDTWAAAVARKLGPRFFLLRTRHNSFPVAGHVFNRWLYRRTIDRLILVSVSLRDGFSSVFSPDEIARLPIIPSSIDLSGYQSFSDEGGEVRRELGLPKDTPLLGVIARLSRNKGQLVLLEALPRLLRQHPKLHVLLVGDGGGRPAAEQRARALGVSDRVHFLGFRDDVPRLQRALSVAVLPSLSCDASSATLKEALAAERPVVATDVGGAREITQNGRTGMIVPPSDPQRLAEAVDWLLTHTDEAAKMGREGRQYVISEFSEDRLVKKTRQIYNELLEHAR